MNQAIEDHFRLLTINVDVPALAPVEEQQKIALYQVKAFPDRIAYATSFTVRNWNDEDWQEKSIAYLKHSFANGAVAIKIWKNIGMELKDKNGKLVMIDNPRFDPLFDYLEKNNIPVIGHLGEPKNCWLPIDEMTVNGDKNYFKQHPQYHMYLHPEYPSYQDQIDARDHILEKHPALLFIGAHLGSLEWDTDELAKHLDKFPNMAVDMAARISHLQYQAISNRQKVRDFMIKYQDRLIYATDLDIGDKKDPSLTRKGMHETWVSDWKFFTSDETMRVAAVDSTFKGLKLPRDVVDKIYRKNAEKWFQGVIKGKQTGSTKPV
jgi:hypothetical protein